MGGGPLGRHARRVDIAALFDSGGNVAHVQAGGHFMQPNVRRPEARLPVVAVPTQRAGRAGRLAEKVGGAPAVLTPSGRNGSPQVRHPGQTQRLGIVLVAVLLKPPSSRHTQRHRVVVGCT